MIAGVAMSIANYFDVDPVLVRAIFVLITVFGGSGLLLYIILWLIFPAEGSSGKMDENTIKENAQELKEKAQEFTGGGNGKYLLGLILLVLGVAFILNNFGFLSLDIWATLWKFWPVIFVIWGLEVIVGKTHLGKALILIIGLAVLVYILASTLFPTSFSFGKQQKTFRCSPFDNSCYQYFNN